MKWLGNYPNPNINTFFNWALEAYQTDLPVKIFFPPMTIILLHKDEDPVLAKKPDPGLCISNEGRLFKVY